MTSPARTVDKETCSEEDLNGLQWTTILYYIREFNYRPPWWMNVSPG